MTVRHCLVTGANRGLGLAFVRELLARGDRVVAACRHPGKATALNTLAGEHPGRLHVLPLDVASAKSRAELVRELPLVLGDGTPGDGTPGDGTPGDGTPGDGTPGDGTPGEGRLDLLLNNAGVLHSGERFGHVEAAILEDSLQVNAAGPFLLAQALAPSLADGATIANLSSVMGSIAGRNEFRSPSYCMSKAAQNMGTVLLARALAPRGIKVVALHPGWVQTEMGGGNANVSADDSARGLLAVIAGLTDAHSGSFLDWQGQALPW